MSVPWEAEETDSHVQHVSVIAWTAVSLTSRSVGFDVTEGLGTGMGIVASLGRKPGGLRKVLRLPSSYAKKEERGP